MQTKVVREVKGLMIGEGQMSQLWWHFIQLFPYLSQMLQGIENCIILENRDTLEDLVCNLPSTFYSLPVLWTAPLNCWKILCWHHWNTPHQCQWKRKSDCSTGTTEKIVLLHLCHWKNWTAPLAPLCWHCWKKKKLVKKSYCFTCATEKNWWASLRNRIAPQAPLKNAPLAPLKWAPLVLLKKIKLVKKLYCATERNGQVPLKKSDCSTSTTEKCSASTSETCSAGAAKKN